MIGSGISLFIGAIFLMIFLYKDPSELDLEIKEISEENC